MAKSSSVFWQQTSTVSIASGTALAKGYFTQNYPLNAETRLLDMVPERVSTFRPADTNSIIQSSKVLVFASSVLFYHVT